MKCAPLSRTATTIAITKQLNQGKEMFKPEATLIIMQTTHQTGVPSSPKMNTRSTRGEGPTNIEGRIIWKLLLLLLIPQQINII